MSMYEVPPCPNPDDPEYVALWDQYQALLKRTTHKEVYLRERFGPTCRLDDASGMAARLDMILDVILPPENPDRIRLEIQWQELVAASLEKLHSNFAEAERKSDIIQKQHGGKRLHLPGGGLL